MHVTRTTSSNGREAENCSFERVTLAWETDSSGVASDVIHLAGQIAEVITAADSDVPGTYSLRLLDPDDTTIDYLVGGFVQALHSDIVEFFEPVVVSDRGPVLCGGTRVQVSDAGNAQTGRTILFLKT